MDSKRSIQVTILVENSATRQGLMAEHGFSVWIETSGKRILFDTGQGLVIKHNAEMLQIPLEKTDAVVFSHGHYDHTGGLKYVLSLNPDHAPAIYMHPEAVLPKYARGGDAQARSIGFPSEGLEAINACGCEIVETKDPVEIFDGIMVTGEVPRLTEYEDTGGPFYCDERCTQKDALLDDQSLYFDTAQGVVVILGCAHAGIINTLRHIAEQTGGRPIHTVIGGMHLIKASSERMRNTIEALCELDLQCISPAHCTGFEAASALRWAFGKHFSEVSVGNRYCF